MGHRAWEVRDNVVGGGGPVWVRAEKRKKYGRSGALMALSQSMGGNDL
jgi:hypothetical protein